VPEPAVEPGEFLELVHAREQVAQAALAGAAGDVSLCALSRAGTPHPAAKFHEGAVSVLAGVRRALVQRPETDPAEAIAEARTSWREQNATLAKRSRDWAAYYEGGVEALDLLAAAAGATD
jgi:hypothetical protein